MIYNIYTVMVLGGRSHNLIMYLIRASIALLVTAHLLMYTTLEAADTRGAANMPA